MTLMVRINMDLAAAMSAGRRTMLEHYIRKPWLRADVRSTALGESVELFAEYLYRNNYAPRVGHRYLSAVRHFAHWMELEGLGMAQLDDSAVNAFVEHLDDCECSVAFGSDMVSLRATASHMLRILREAGLAPPRPTPVPTATDGLLREFDAHLERLQGAHAKTRQVYVWCVRPFVESLNISTLDDLGRVRPADIIRFIETRTHTYSAGTVRHIGTGLRSLFRFAQMRGACGPRLALAVPPIRDSSAGRLPKALTGQQAAQFLRGFDRSSPLGRRDFAMARCLLDLGLRTGEVAALNLDDIDWRAGTMRIVAHKGRRSTVLPIPASTATAISTYLRRGRPPTRARAVFVRHGVHVGRPLAKPAVRSAVRRGFERAGVDTPSRGPHLLRRTAATRMVQGGAGLKAVADVLRQRSISTTMTYTRIDIPHLAEVAMPWPEGR